MSLWPAVVVLALARVVLAADECGPEQGDTCVHADDGVCDDGGYGALYFACPFDTDCKDCGGARGVDEAHMSCNDACRYALDGACDDGGPASAYFECRIGSDCTDCGDAGRVGSAEAQAFCENTCAFASDNVCDDGGVHSHTEECGPATDCADCGVRNAAEVELFSSEQKQHHMQTGGLGAGVNSELPEDVICENTCYYHGDGKCDDSGPGSVSHECLLGTDCHDCGHSHRGLSPAPPPVRPALPPGCQLTTLINVVDAGMAAAFGCHRLHEFECEYYRINDHPCVWMLEDCVGTCLGAPASGPHCEAAASPINCSVSPPPSPPPPPPGHSLKAEAESFGPPICNNACPLARNEVCDDGGPGAAYSDCPWGADCDDCGERPSVLCTDSCFWHGDHECDDGDARHGAKWDECTLGTDCTDCGPRRAATHWASSPRCTRSRTGEGRHRALRRQRLFPAACWPL